MNAQHTPTPWTYREAFENGEPCGYVVQCGANAIADVPQGEHDAQFIVRACNCHDELVEALLGLLKTVGYYADRPAGIPFTPLAWKEMNDAMSDANAILKKARGEA